MTFLICMPVCHPGMSSGDTAGDDDDPAPSLDPSDKLIAIISFIREDQSVSQIMRLQQCLCHADIIAVATGEQETQGVTEPIRYHMDLCRQSSPAPSGLLVVAPFLAPLPCWCTFTVVLSSISVVSSTRSCAINVWKIRSHTPARVHVRKRLYTVCHGP